MQGSRGIARLAALAAALLTLGACENDPTGPSQLSGRRIYGVTDDNVLVLFGSASAGRPTHIGVLTGLQSGEQVLGVDFRPVDGRLYAIGSTSRLYLVDTATAVATPIGAAPFTPALAGSDFGFDFNPVPDRVRVHGNTGQNLRLNQLTGALAALDTALTYSAGDPGAGATPSISATAYTNSVAGAATTSLFAIDYARDVLVVLPLPNSGRMVTVGGLGVNAGADAGLDIVAADGVAYAALTVGTRTSLYTVSLTTGAATAVGELTGVGTLRGIAVAP